MLRPWRIVTLPGRARRRRAAVITSVVVGLLAPALAACGGPGALPPAASPPAPAAPVVIYHAFQRPFRQLTQEVCALGRQGYSHVQLSPAQRSSPGAPWWKRYQPLDHTVIEGLGSEVELRALTARAHRCGVKVIADVVFNHMADLQGGPDREDLRQYPGLTPADFHALPPQPQAPGLWRRPCVDSEANGYADGDRRRELTCWLGGLPDLRFTPTVLERQRRHLARLGQLGVDGFRFDAAKHIPPEVLRDHLATVRRLSGGRAWSYLEVIGDGDTRAEDFAPLAPVTDFTLYRALRRAVSWDGDLRELPPAALSDRRSVSFGRNHDTIAELRDDPGGAIDPWSDVGDAWLATAIVLAREAGTPLIFGEDHRRSAVIRQGVRFRRAISERARAGRPVEEMVLRVVDSPQIALIERGAEGFLALNKGAEVVDQPVLDLSLTRLEGCYVALGSGTRVTIERREARKFVTRWGEARRGGLRLQGRDAQFFLRQPWARCFA